MKHKFNIGDCVVSDTRTQRYIIVEIDEYSKTYLCVDALCGRVDLRRINFGKYMFGFANESDFEIDDSAFPPIIADENISRFNLINIINNYGNN